MMYQSGSLSWRVEKQGFKLCQCESSPVLKHASLLLLLCLTNSCSTLKALLKCYHLSEALLSP